MFRGHSILIYFAVCATSLAGWNANIWPASNTSPRYVVASAGGTNIYAKDMWSWQCHSALVERASLAGVPPPTGTNFYRFEHDNLQAMKDWVEAYCTKYLAITGTVEQLEETLATGIAFTNAVHYWTPTGMIAAFNLPTNFFDYTPYRDLNNYAGTQNSPQIFTNVVETGFVYVVCGEQADNCYKYIELGEICGYKCYETTVITNDGQYGWDALRLCITNLKWTYSRCASNDVVLFEADFGTNSSYTYDSGEIYYAHACWARAESNFDMCCDAAQEYITNCYSIAETGVIQTCSTFDPIVRKETNDEWNSVYIRESCEIHDYIKSRTGYGDWFESDPTCVDHYEGTYSLYSREYDYSYFLDCNSWTGLARCYPQTNAYSFAANVWVYERVNANNVTNKITDSYSITNGTTEICVGNYPDSFYSPDYFICEPAPISELVYPSVGLSWTDRAATNLFELQDAGINTNIINRWWTLKTTYKPENSFYTLDWSVSYNLHTPPGKVLYDETFVSSVELNCDVAYTDIYGVVTHEYAGRTDSDTKTEYRSDKKTGTLSPQVPYYLFEWEFEYD